jgi:hypothetical protein
MDIERNQAVDAVAVRMDSAPGALGMFARLQHDLLVSDFMQTGTMPLVGEEPRSGALVRQGKRLMDSRRPGSTDTRVPVFGDNPLYEGGKDQWDHGRITHIGLDRTTGVDPKTGASHDRLEVAILYRTGQGGIHEHADALAFDPNGEGGWNMTAVRYHPARPGGDFGQPEDLVVRPRALEALATQLDTAIRPTLTPTPTGQ